MTLVKYQQSAFIHLRNLNHLRISCQQKIRTIQYFLNGTSQKHGSHMLHARNQINASHIPDAFYFPNVSLHFPTKSILEISNLMDDNPQQKKRLV